MAKLYYGNGNCTIEGSEIRGVEIRYRGAIEITSNAGDKFAIANQNNGIIIFPIADGFLSNLFDYTGEFRILSVIVADNNAEKIPTTIHRVMDYTELLTSNSEDMTTNSEDLKQTYVSGQRVNKTTLKQPFLKDLHTSKDGVELYFKDGGKYEGKYKIDLRDNGASTESGEPLYFRDGKPTKNPNLVPYAAIKQNRERKRINRKISNNRRNRRY